MGADNELRATRTNHPSTKRVFEEAARNCSNLQTTWSGWTGSGLVWPRPPTNGVTRVSSVRCVLFHDFLGPHVQGEVGGREHKP